MNHAVHSSVLSLCVSEHQPIPSVSVPVARSHCWTISRLLALTLLLLIGLPIAGRAEEEEVLPANQPRQSTDVATPDVSIGEKRQLSADSGVGNVPEKESPTSIPVLDQELFQRFSQWLTTQETPAYNVLSVSLDGNTEKDRAVLTARIDIQINRDDEWVLIPLGLDQAFLLDAPQHQFRGTGLGENRPDNASLTDKRGNFWWFRGRGVHSLTFPISVPVEKNRLELKLPDPPAASSYLKLRVVKLPNISVKSPERSSTKVETVNGASEITLHGLGTLLDVAWQPIPDEKRVRNELQSTTLVLVQLGVESIVLEAYQTIRAVSGSFDHVTVRLPKDFELLDVTGDELQEYQTAADGRMSLSLTEPTTDQARFKWILSTERVPDELRLPLLEGFDVEGARRQSGYLAVQTIEGYHVLKHGEGDLFVYQVNVSDLHLFPEMRAAVGTGQIISAFRFLSQPFRLALDIEKIEPYHTAEPVILLKLLADRAEVEAVFHCQVYRGALRELKLHWPGLTAQKWNLNHVESAEIVEQIVPDPNASSDTFTIRLIQPRTRADGPFDIRIQGQRAIDSAETALTLDLPNVEASTLPPRSLVVAKADNIEAEITPVGKTVFSPSAKPLQQFAEFSELARDVRSSVFRIDSAQQTFAIKMTAHEQHIQTKTSLHAEFQKDRLLVMQHILYNVDYERLPQVRLLVPKELAEGVQFHTTTSGGTTTNPVLPSWGELEVDTFRRARITLDKPALGAVEVIAEYSVDLPADSDTGEPTVFSMPLLLSGDADYASVQIELAGTGGRIVRVNDEGWQQYLTMERTTVWSVNSHKTQIPLSMEPTGNFLMPGLSIPKALFRTVFDEQGTATTCAMFQIRGDWKVLPIRLAKGTAVDSFWWNHHRISDDQITKDAASATEYRVDVSDLPTGNIGSHVLTVIYSTDRVDPLGWTDSCRILMPELPANLRMGQTYWQVTLPFTQHLFTYPAALTPQFSWKRSTLFWKRTPVRRDAELVQWIASTDGSVAHDSDERLLPWEPVDDFRVSAFGNSYLFGAYGIPVTVSFRTMSRPAIVGIGAGLALFIALVLLKVSATRHVLTLLCLILAFVVTGLSFEAPVKLLLQPALLGLLLALVAVVIDTAVKRRRLVSVIPFSSPGELVASASSAEHVAVPISEYGHSAEDRSDAPDLPAPVSAPVTASEAGDDG